MKSLITALILLSVFEGNLLFAQPQITAREIRAHINYLASDEMKGRETGSPELYTAARYVKHEFEKYKLTPFFQGSFFQEFSFISGLKQSDSCEFAISDGKSLVEYINRLDFASYSFSGLNHLTAPLVFAGFGISAPEIAYDDYAGIDVKGKIAIVFRSTPDSGAYYSAFEKHSENRIKAQVAKEHGAAGIIFVNSYIDETDVLYRPGYDGAPPMNDFPVIQIKRYILEDLMKNNGHNASDIYKYITSKKKPASIVFDNLLCTVKAGVNFLTKKSVNVAAYIPGSDSLLKNEYVVIGAHLDHLGMGMRGSRYSGSIPQIHNGADDNASGVAGILELAEKFASDSIKPKRSIIFVAFSGEELGFLGSEYFVKNLNIDDSSITAMINLDMIGRLQDRSLTVFGTGSSDVWENYISEKNKNYKFRLTLKKDGSGGSDQSQFYFRGIPVLFFFTGYHPDYHMPSDDAHKISPEGEQSVLSFVYDIAREITSGSIRPKFRNISEF